MFMIYIFRYVSASKRSQEKEFALLDRERQHLIELQKELKADATSARESTKDGLAKLQKIGLETHAEWNDMTARFDEVVSEIEARSNDLVDQLMQKLNKKGLECSKTIALAESAKAELDGSVVAARKVARFFDSQVPVEHVLHELQQDKYQEARRLLNLGSDANAVARKLGLSLSEVSMVAHSLGA
jgi:ribosome-associated translation inhibitor RaiA